MIDDKKIVEASEKYAKEMEETCKELAEKYKSATSLCNWVTVNPEAAFQDGINWFLKNLWHPAIEKPRRNTIYLAQIGNCAFDTFFDSKNWENFSKGNYITRWLYINDLLPKKGGEQ